MTVLVIETPDGPQQLPGATYYQHPATHPASMIEESEAKKFVSQDEKDIWNQGGSSYTHPETHPASMIEQDVEHLFVTQTEKDIWNVTPDIPPTNPSPYDDEFNDNMISGWSDYNFASGIKSEGSGSLKMRSTSTALAVQGLLKAGPNVSDFTIITKLLGAGKSTPSHRYGIVIAESDSGKNFVVSAIAQGGAAASILYENMNTPTSRAGYSLGYSIGPIFDILYLKVRVYNVAGVWKADIQHSNNGRRYYTYAREVPINFTPMFIGLMVNNEGEIAEEDCWFDWFRVIEN